MINPKSIVFVIHGLPMGGAEKFLISIVNHLFEIKYDPVVIILSNDVTLAHEITAGIPIIRVLKKSRFDLSISHRIKQQIIIHGARKIFCVNPYSYFLTKLSFLFEDDYQIYLSPHTTKPFSLYNWFQTFVYYRFIGKKDTVIYLCNKQHDSIRESFSIDKNDKLILLVARINPEKRHTDALNALSIVHKMRGVIKPHLMIVGSGNQRLSDKLKELVSILQLDGYVHFVGNHSDVRVFYFIADIFTLTSESETFSIAALEAMAFGLPCALTDVGGAREMIVEDWNGTLADPLHPDSIAKAWVNALKNNQNGHSIREHVQQRFSLNSMLKQYVHLLFQPIMISHRS